MPQLGRYRKGDILDRLVADIDALDQLYLRLFSPLFSAVVVTGLVSLFLAFFNTTLATVVFVVMSSWILLMPVVFYRLGRRTGETLGVRQARLRQEVLDYLQGMAVQQIYGNDASARAAISDSESRLSQAQKTMAGLTGMGLSAVYFRFRSGCIIDVVSGRGRVSATADQWPGHGDDGIHHAGCL